MLQVTKDGLTTIAAVGEEINLAARIASQAEAGEILISRQAPEVAGLEGAAQEERDLEGLKGISRPVSAGVMPDA